LNVLGLWKPPKKVDEHLDMPLSRREMHPCHSTMVRTWM
jgi:hypothetical protein